MVTIGIDTHKATLAVSAIDGTGCETGARTFPNDRQGHVGLLRWAQAHGSERRFGIEGSGVALARLLVAAGEAVVEVPAVFTHRERRHLRRAGKSDPGDALRSPGWSFARRASARSPCPGSPRIRKLLVDARDQRVGERTRVANRLHADLVVLAAGYTREVPNLAGACHRAAVARLLDGLAGVRAELARADLARLRELDAECAALERSSRSCGSGATRVSS
jgi:hypothetical protein